MCSAHGLSQKVSFPTHEVDSKLMFSCLDLVLTNRSSLVKNVRANPPLGKSHHVLVSFELDMRKSVLPPPPKVTAPNLSKLTEDDWVCIREYLDTCDFSPATPGCTRAERLNSLVSCLTQHIQKAMNSSCRKQRKSGLTRNVTRQLGQSAPPGANGNPPTYL